MPYSVSLSVAKADFPEFEFIEALTPSEQKCAFHVKDRRTGSDLCLKLIAPNYSLDRLNREIQALQQIDHPNVVRFVEYTYSSKQSSVQHYIVEEFIHGSDLADHFKGTPWELDRTVAFFTSIADALEALRRIQVVHRDLKPQNIRVRPDDSPVVIDFGLARHLSRSDLTKSAHGAQIGTPLYFAPEQFQGTKRDIDHRTDLFTVGVLLHCALVGFHPFARDTRTDLEEAVCGGFEPSSDFDALPPKWKLVVTKLLAVERSKRLNTAGQLRTLLGKVET